MLFAERRAMLPVLGFWFGTDNDAAEHRCRQWLEQGPGLQADLGEWAAPLAELAASGGLDHIAARPYGSVALSLLLDATPRVLWRDTPHAYASDLAAQGHVLNALATRQDARLDRWQRLMLYLPLMHAETLAVQDRSVQEYESVLIGAKGPEKEVGQAFLELALEHRDVIWRFGRFPDRNAVLHRLSSLEEKWYLHDTERPWFAAQPVTGEVAHEIASQPVAAPDAGPPTPLPS